MSLRSATFVLVGVLFASLGCAPDEPGTTPESTVRAFVAAMERAELDDRARADVLALIDPESRAELAGRARRASHLARRAVEPWEMFVQGSFRLRVPLDRMRAEIDGDNATVHVSGGGREASVPLVLEPTDDGPRWRVVLLSEPPASD